MQSKILIYSHVFKTGGTTLTARIASQIGYEHHGIFNTLETDPAHFSNIDDLKFVSGHDLFGIHTDLEKPSYYITMLRDPWKRFESAFSNLKEKPEHPASDYFNQQSAVDLILGLSDIMYPYSFTVNQIDNHMVREFSGHQWEDRYMDESDLDCAIQNLQTYYVGIGFLSNIEKYWKLLCRKFKWDSFVEANARHNNKTLVKESLDDRVHHEFVKLNQLDYKLFDWAYKNQHKINEKTI